MKIQLGAVSLDVSDIASQGNAILGIRDSGKTWAAILLAEKLITAGIPIIAFDPIGRWRHLGTPGTGKGFPIVVAGGEHGDLPLTPQSAPEIVRAAMRERVSLVLDLYSMELSKADWRRIVASAVQTLLYENKAHGLRHLFIEEAAEFCPQIVGPDAGKVYDQIERLARMGGNALLGYTLINQRAEQVNKAVLELCDNLLLFRQKGKNSLTSLSKWLDIGSAAQGKEIIGSLPTLPQGTCWIWAAGTDHPVKVKMPGIQTFSPDRRSQHGAAGKAMPARVDVGKFVEGMKGALEKVLAEAAANDPAVLKRRIAELERQVGQQGASLAELEAATLDGHAAGHADAVKAMRPLVDRIEEALLAVSAQIVAVREVFISSPSPEAPKMNTPRPFPPVPVRNARPAPMPNRPTSKPSDLPRGELATLKAIAQYPAGATREQLSVLTGYKRSSRDAYIQRLKEKGLVEIMPDGALIATGHGIDALGSDYEPLPTGAALQDYWLGRLPEGERKVLEYLLGVYPAAAPREGIDEATSYKRSSRDAYIQRLKSRQLVVIESGKVRASDHLFGSQR